jgi:ATPase subunit of ABC transporter with duplicated ATPase domains
MTHKPIEIRELSLSLPHKNCFEDFSATIRSGERIAIIGKNGSGKSTLLKILLGLSEPTYGRVTIPVDVEFGYVQQVIEDFRNKSGGQRFHESLNEALVANPSVLLLDEPTNHLDSRNRKSLMRMINVFEGTVIVVSHDKELLRNCFDIFWHIDNESVSQFSGKFDDYIRERDIGRSKIMNELSALGKEKKGAHSSLMKEQKRASNSKDRGKKSIDNKKWPTIVGKSKATRAEQTSGKKKADIRNKKDEVLDKLQNLRLPEEIKAKFSITTSDCINSNVVAIKDGAVGYGDFIVQNINISIGGTERVAILGDNGSGKSTLIKAIMGLEEIKRDGEWYVPKNENIGYLDQHYSLLNGDESVFDSIEKLYPSWNDRDVRNHLNDFLFRKNEEVEILVKNLSGGEKARLSLACIAAKTPKVLILDEITNNLDMDTIDHVVQVIRDYPGAVLAISHNKDFLDQIGIATRYVVHQGSLVVER